MIAGRRWLSGMCAMAGVVLAHTVIYALVHPDPAARAHHMAASGHGYWPAALVVAGLAAAVAMVAVVIGAATSGRRGTRTGFGGRWLRLTGCQVALFAAMELLEGAVTGNASPALVGHPQFLLGLVLQLVVAAAILVVLGLLQRTTERLVCLRTGRGPCSRRAIYPWSALRWWPRTTLSRAARPRGPPALVRG